MDVFNRVLTVLYLFNQMPMSSSGAGAAEIARWAGVSRSTAWRYLKMMIDGGHVKAKPNRHNKRGGNVFVITNKGLMLWKMTDDIPF